jgi:hypothetical protein
MPRLDVRHESRDRYAKPVAFGDHGTMFRPCPRRHREMSQF